MLPLDKDKNLYHHSTTKTQSIKHMSPTRHPLTPDQVKAKLRARGVTCSDWARQNGYSPQKVIRLLNGYEKGHYGQSHEIAVKLGLKADPELA